MKKKGRRELTEKQRKFIAFYSGNGVEAARRAGYDGDDTVLASVAYENLRKPQLREAIKKRSAHDIQPLTATRLIRQKFWTKVMMSAQSSMKDRLKASELLGKSEADFTDNVIQTGETKVTLIAATADQIEEAVQSIEKKL